MNLIAADTGPINYLIQVESIGHLQAVFGQVVLPTGVAAELEHPGAPAAVRDWMRTLPEWIEVREIGSGDLRGFRGLSDVDLQVLALGLELGIPLLSDDLGVRTAAIGMGLKVIGTLGFLEVASARSLLDLGVMLNRLKQTTIRLSDRLYDEALARDASRRKESPRTGDRP